MKLEDFLKLELDGLKKLTEDQLGELKKEIKELQNKSPQSESALSEAQQRSEQKSPEGHELISKAQELIKKLESQQPLDKCSAKNPPKTEKKTEPEQTTTLTGLFANLSSMFYGSLKRDQTLHNKHTQEFEAFGESYDKKTTQINELIEQNQALTDQLSEHSQEIAKLQEKLASAERENADFRSKKRAKEEEGYQKYLEDNDVSINSDSSLDPDKIYAAILDASQEVKPSETDSSDNSQPYTPLTACSQAMLSSEVAKRSVKSVTVVSVTADAKPKTEGNTECTSTPGTPADRENPDDQKKSSGGGWFDW